MKDLIDHQIYKQKQGVHFDSDGSFTHYRSMDAQPIVDAVKANGEGVTLGDRMKSTMRHEGSIDIITAGNWAKECGAAIGTKEFTKYAGEQLRSGKYNKFRTHYTS